LQKWGDCEPDGLPPFGRRPDIGVVAQRHSGFFAKLTRRRLQRDVFQPPRRRHSLARPSTTKPQNRAPEPPALAHIFVPASTEAAYAGEWESGEGALPPRLTLTDDSELD
jgi:hypothetical protein